MGKELDLSWFSLQFSKGKDFEVPEKIYEEKIGKPLPKTHYLKYGSPLARLAKEHHFKIKVIEKPIIQRTLFFQGEE